MIYLHIRVHMSSCNISLVFNIKSKAEDNFCKAVIVILHSTKTYPFHGPRISVTSVATASEIHATDMLLLNVVGNKYVRGELEVCRTEPLINSGCVVYIKWT